MDRINDANVIRLVDRIGEHYRNNITSRFLRPVLLQLQIDKATWDMIEVLTEKMDQFVYLGFNLDELYRQIAACTRLIEVARNITNIKNKIKALPSAGQDQVLRDMAVSNFSSNLQVFANLVNELYICLVEIDKKKSGKNPPVYTQIYELYNIERLVAGK